MLLVSWCSDLDLTVPPAEGDPPAAWWDEAMDLSLLVGVFKFGMHHCQ